LRGSIAFVVRQAGQRTRGNTLGRCRMLTRDEAQRIAANIVKLSDLLHRAAK
jgi:hypothetical protein